jgi:mannose/fructose/sorbose-specific phosphotransferase system IIA component
MIGILVTTHGDLCQGMLNSLTMIAGENPNIFALQFNDFSNYTEKLIEKLNVLTSDYNGVLIFTDIMGGTPFNESYKYIRENNKSSIKIITGVNLPMIVETSLALSHEDNLNNLVDIAIEAGKSSINCVC